MGRSTKGYIPRNNVDIGDIIEILNSDSKNLTPDKLLTPDNLDVREIFDQIEQGRKGNLYGAFVNGDGKPNTAPATRDQATDYTTFDPQVPGTTPEDLLNQLKGTGSFDLGDLRGYGGSEMDPPSTSGTPTIYWKNIIDKQNTEHSLSTNESDESIRETRRQFFPQITMFPETSVLEENTDSIIKDTKNLAGDYQSVMFTEDKLTETQLATKIGIDYPVGYDGDKPEFKIKITPRIADLTTEIDRFKETFQGDTPWEIPVVPIPTFLKYLGLGEIVTASTLMFSQLVTDGTLAVTAGDAGVIILDYLWGWLEPFVKIFIPDPNVLLPKIVELVEGAASSVWTSVAPFVKGILLPFLQGVAVAAGAMILSDVIWDFLHNPAEIIYAHYQFKNHAYDIYNFADISESSYDLSFGEKYVGNDDKTNYLINEDSTSHEYNVEDYNYSGIAFSESNLITQFPNNSAVKNKYMNFDFLAESTQYDLDTAPPLIEYYVEIIPVRNCVLHNYKTTAFSVLIMPEKYKAPKFEITTSSMIDGIPALYKNTSMTCRNARYCDFIRLHRPEETDTFLGTYNESWINLPHWTTGRGGEETWQNNLINYTGNNLSGTGHEYFNNSIVNIPTTYPAAGIYEVHFSQKKDHPNYIRNPYFRAERDITNTILEKYWEYSDNVTISKGAAYYNSDGSEGYIKQYLPNFFFSTDWTRYHILKLNVTVNSGELYFKYNGLFKDWYYSYFGYYESNPLVLHHPYYGQGTGSPDAKIEESTSPEGLKIKESGDYILILEARGYGENRWFEFSFPTSFDGHINSTKLVYAGVDAPGYVAEERVESINNLYGNNLGTPTIKWMNGEITYKNIIMTYYDEQMVDGIYSNISLDTITDAVEDVDVTYSIFDNTIYSDTYSNGITSFSNQIDGYQILKCDVQLNLIQTGGIVTLTQLKQTNSFTCNDNKVTTITTEADALYEANVDISGTSIYSTFRDMFPYKLNGLDISNTLITDSVGNLDSIVEFFKANNTKITGSLASIVSIPHLELDNTNISSYGVGMPKYEPGTKPYIVWKNSNISLTSLKQLLIDLDFSATENGYLDIGGNNPIISDTYALDAIDSLIAKGWNIIYNAYTEDGGVIVDNEEYYLVDNEGIYVGNGDSETVGI